MTPIISVGENVGGVMFEGLPDGIGLTNGEAPGTVDVYVSGSLAGTVAIIGDGDGLMTPAFVDLSAFSNVTRIEIDPNPDPAGLGFDDFCFESIATCGDGGMSGNYCLQLPFSTGRPSTISANQSSASIAAGASSSRNSIPSSRRARISSGCAGLWAACLR